MFIFYNIQILFQLPITNRVLCTLPNNTNSGETGLEELKSIAVKMYSEYTYLQEGKLLCGDNVKHGEAENSVHFRQKLEIKHSSTWVKVWYICSSKK